MHEVATTARRTGLEEVTRRPCSTALLLVLMLAFVGTPSTAAETPDAAVSLSVGSRHQPHATAATMPEDLAQLSPAKPAGAITGHQAIRVALGEPLWTVMIAVTEIVVRTIDVARRLVESLLDTFRTTPRTLAGFATFLGTTLVAAIPYRRRDVPDGTPDSLAKS